MQHIAQPTAAVAARQRVCQLRSDGKLHWHNGLLLSARMLTLVFADCGVLRERYRGRDHVLALVEDGGG